MQDYRNTPDGRAAEKKYGDIINLRRPASRHPKMDHIQRAKIFAPFDALRGFDAEIDIAQSKTRQVKRIDLSEEQKGNLSDKLLQVRKGMHITVQYFVPGNDKDTGNYVETSGTVERIDPIGRMLGIRMHTTDTTVGKIEKILPTVIKFDDLLDISSQEIKDIDEYLGIEPE